MSIAFLAIVASLSGAPADEAGADPQYQDCIERISRDISDGRAYAEQWLGLGGGAPALHCLAVADLAAGFPRMSAMRLEELAARTDAGEDMVRARIFSQAALAWLEAEAPDDAERALNAALARAPDSGELQLTAAKVYAAQEKQQATIDAVNAAEVAGFASADGYVLRARARIALADHRGAADDVVAALKLEPTHLDALVLRGELFEHGIDIDADYVPTN